MKIRWNRIFETNTQLTLYSYYLEKSGYSLQNERNEERGGESNTPVDYLDANYYLIDLFCDFSTAIKMRTEIKFRKRNAAKKKRKIICTCSFER